MTCEPVEFHEFYLIWSLQCDHEGIS